MTIKKLLTAIIALALAASTVAGARSADNFGSSKGGVTTQNGPTNWGG